VGEYGNIMKMVIPGTLPGLNEIINQSKSHWNEYRTMKWDYTMLVKMCARGLNPVEQADFIITWFCPDKRRDKDNVIAGQKFLFDGLRAAGVIENDGWKQIRDITHRFEVDKLNPRIEVEIIEVKEGEHGQDKRTA